MRTIGYLLIIVGIGIGIFAYRLDTTIQVNYHGLNSYGLPDRVVNLELMNKKQNYIFASGIFTLAGIILFALGVNAKSEQDTDNKIQFTESKSKETTSYCSNCGNPCFTTDKFCSHCGLLL